MLPQLYCSLQRQHACKVEAWKPQDTPQGRISLATARACMWIASGALARSLVSFRPRRPSWHTMCYSKQPQYSYNSLSMPVVGRQVLAASRSLRRSHREHPHLHSTFDMYHELANHACNHEMENTTCLLYTSPSPRDRQKSRMPSSA